MGFSSVSRPLGALQTMVAGRRSWQMVQQCSILVLQQNQAPIILGSYVPSSYGYSSRPLSPSLRIPLLLVGFPQQSPSQCQMLLGPQPNVSCSGLHLCRNSSHTPSFESCSKLRVMFQPLTLLAQQRPNI